MCRLWQDPPTGTEVPASGTVTADFGDAYGEGAIRIWTCPAEQWSTACTVAAQSPELTVWPGMEIGTVGSLGPFRSGVQHASYWWGPQADVTGVTPTGTWELLGSDQQPLSPAVTGPLTSADLAIADPDTFDSELTFTVPDGLPSGTYYLDIHMSADTADFGHLQGSIGAGPQAITVDNDAPALTVRKTSTALYPIYDDYLDTQPLYTKSDESVLETLEVTDSHGARVYRSPAHSVYPSTDFNWTDPLVWNGRRGDKAHSRIVPEGRYRMTLTATDAAGNATTWAAPITVSHKHLQWTTFHRTVAASQSLVNKPYVGKCSTLSSPAKGGKPGSLGYYSASRCHGSSAANGVATTSGMYIPKAYKHHYLWSQVTLNGGPATSAKSNYMYLAYLRPHSKKLWDGRFLTAKGQGAHPGMRASGGLVFDRSKDKPYVLWSNGLNAGSRYDVRSFTVTVRYQALRE